MGGATPGDDEVTVTDAGIPAKWGITQGILGRLDSEATHLCLGRRYSVSERRWTQMLAGAEDGGPGPSPRSFHAAAYVPAGRGAMYLLGGLTAGGVTRDFWVLNLTTLQWRQEKVSVCPTPRACIWAPATVASTAPASFTPGASGFLPGLQHKSQN